MKTAGGADTSALHLDGWTTDRIDLHTNCDPARPCSRVKTFKEDGMTVLANLRRSMPRPFVPLLAVAALLVAGCAQVGTNSYTFWDGVYSLIVFFFLFTFLMIFISLFGDIFRRNDLSGGAKAGWVLLLVILPFLGCLIYMIVRPKVTQQDVQMMAQAEAANRAVASVSTADELTKLQQLKDSGAITEAQYQDLKAKTLAG
jgi:hypothetical protein